MARLSRWLQKSAFALTGPGMRQKLGLIITVVGVVALLVVINTFTYVAEEDKHDSELDPNRSTYHSGPTGTRALYDLLSESGFSVMRWRQVPEKLLSEGRNVRTFVIVGSTKLSIADDEASNLMHWVQRGGRLVLVDRLPEVRLLPAAGDWAITTHLQGFPLNVDPGKPEEMTENVKAVRPEQPTEFTRAVATVLPSRFAASIGIAPESTTGDNADFLGDEEQPSPLPVQKEAANSTAPKSPAPVVHLSGPNGSLLVDYPHGLGRIIVLTDPYIFSNGGIRLADNVQLAINMLTSDGGLIAFDEFHQGRAATGNPFVSYFSGTPILALGAQLALLVLLILWTQGRRFARPLPLARVDRRSALEFVASMAEVQQRARAFDLAIENIYSHTRRVLARYAGLAYNSPRAEIATRVAARSSVDGRKLEVLMRQCEEAINGQPISEKQSITLVKRLREVEATLGLRMRSRDLKQAGQKIG